MFTKSPAAYDGKAVGTPMQAHRVGSASNRRAREHVTDATGITFNRELTQGTQVFFGSSQWLAVPGEVLSELRRATGHKKASNWRRTIARLWTDAHLECLGGMKIAALRADAGTISRICGIQATQRHILWMQLCEAHHSELRGGSLTLDALMAIHDDLVKREATAAVGVRPAHQPRSSHKCGGGFRIMKERALQGDDAAIERLHWHVNRRFASGMKIKTIAKKLGLSKDQVAAIVTNSSRS